ncbi:transposase [Streptomyces sp. NPDC016734]|uniref:transposase n=1 Tax=Streptomyces sp. NPDC016734 TaxID=3364971 RepID=UPI0037AB6D08
MLPENEVGHRANVFGERAVQPKECTVALSRHDVLRLLESLRSAGAGSTRALYAVIMEAHVHGVSTRSVDDLVEALGSDTGTSRSEVSRICTGLDEQLEVLCTRPLDHIRFPYLILDATSVKARSITGSSPRPSSSRPASPRTVAARSSA